MKTPGRPSSEHLLPAALPPPLPVAKPGEDFARLAPEIRENTSVYVRSSLAEGTLKNYESDWRTFAAWCERQSVSKLPAETKVIAAYLADRAESGCSVSTIRGDLCAITHAHELAGFPLPSKDGAIRAVMRGITRKVGTRPKKKAPVAAGDLAAAIVRRTATGTTTAIRDRAILLLGFLGGFRRSELVAIHMEHIVADPKNRGLKILIPRSKTDQAGEGRWVVVLRGKRGAPCPVEALHAWLTVSGITEGPVFRSIKNGQLGKRALCAKWVERIVKDVAQEAGLDARAYAAHSLRSGFVTTSRAKGHSLEAIARQCGHKDLKTTLGYVQFSGDHLFEDNASEGLL